MAKIAKSCQKLPNKLPKVAKKKCKICQGLPKSGLKKCQKLLNFVKSCHELPKVAKKGQQVRKSFQKLPRVDKKV